MVTPAMQQQPQVIYGPNGERAEWNGREYVVATQAATPAASPGYRIQPMTTPADTRAQQDQAWQAEDRQYRRQRDGVTDARAEESLRLQQEAAQRSAQSQNLVGADARARFKINLGPLQAAQGNMERLDQDGYNPSSLRNAGAAALEAIPFDGGLAARVAGGADYNAYNQAAKTFEAAIMPIMSGAAVTPSEAQRLIRAALPQPGDTPEVLAQKSAQRRMMINAVAEGIGQPAPYDVTAAADALDNGSGNDEAVGAVQPGGAGPASQDPGSGPDSPVDISGLSAQDLMALQPGQYIRFPDGRVEQLSGAPRLGADGREVAPGVFQSEEPGAGQAGMILGADQAFQRSALEQVPLADEAMAGFTSLVTGNSYQDVRKAQAGLADLDRQNQPIARNVGGVAGATALAATPLGAPIRATRGATLAGRVANRAVGGAVGGAAWGFGQGEGNALERLDDAGRGAAFGASGGVIAPPVANALGRIAAPVVGGAMSAGRAMARPVVNALGERAPTALREAVQPNPLASGLDRFADRMGAERINALNPRAVSQRELGMEPTLVDALDDASVGRVRALATRDTPARDSAVRFAEGRRANLPSRTARIAREEISNDTRPAMDILDTQRAARRSNASSIDTFGEDLVPVDGNVSQALQSRLVRTTFGDAAERAAGSLDATDRASASMLAGLANGTASLRSLTVRQAQDISKALNDAAATAFRNGSPDGPVLRDLAGAIRGSARDSSEGYAAWLQKYGEDSDLMEAATTGRNFVSVSNDPLNARSTEAFVRNAEGASDAGRDIMRASAREAVETASSNPGSARTTLDRFAGDADQARRAQALGIDAGRLQARSRAELDAVTAAQRSSPRIGSESSTNLQDAGDAAGAVLGAVRRPVSTAFGAIMNRVASRGFSDAQAEAIVMAAQNPARTDELIGMLSERMSRREARNLARAIRYQLTTGPQSAQQR